MPIHINHAYFLLIMLLIPVIWVFTRRSFLAQISNRKRILVFSVRALLIIILGLSLCDPIWLTHSDKVNLIFCLDMSESIGNDQRERAKSFMHKAAASMGSEDQAGLVLFGKQASLEHALDSNFRQDVFRSQVNSNKTNIFEALQFSIGKFPPKGEKRIVIFTDGNENLNNAEEVAYQAGSIGVKIFPVSLSSWFDRNEVYIRSVQAPPTVPLETPYEIRVVAVGTSESRGEVVLFRDNKFMANRTIQIKPGKNVFVFTDTLSDPGLLLYKAVINSADDTFFQNNEGMSFTRGTRRSQVMYVSGESGDSYPLAEALKLQGVDLVRLDVNEIPGSINDLLEYNGIILNNVSGRHLSLSTMENLERYVKDTGGGLIMIGGDNSFGAGFYKKTPVEKALPVFMDAPTDIKFTRLLLIFIIDKSASMSAAYSGKTKLEMAKVAAFSAIEMLNPTDSIGIMAFDSEYYWPVPVISAGNRKQIAERLSVLREGGGTVLYPALKDAYKVLDGYEAGKKHVIVLSDGETDEADFETLVKSMRNSGISVSTVSIGTNSNIDLMKSIARWGNGRSYYTDDPRTIPKIFTGETKIVAKWLITEKTMKPQTMLSNEMLQGIDTENLPVIYGQVITYPKPGANVLIKTPEGPLLAAWRYGLGRSVAFSSDLSGRWGREWLKWEHFIRFVTQMVKWTQRKETPSTYEVDFKRKGENGTLVVDVLNPDKGFTNYLNLKTKIMFPSEATQTLSLDQIAPGRYRSDFPAEEIGQYYFTLYSEESDETGPQKVFGYGIPYTDEFKDVGVNQTLLKRLADLTNGKVLSLKNAPADLFSSTIESRTREKPLWPYLAIAFLILLLADVTVRKLIDLGGS